VNVNFSLPRSGIFDLRFRIRTGVAPYPQSLLGYYSYKLDGGSVTPVVDQKSLTRTEGYTIWGMVVLSDKSLNAGSHTLEVTFNQEYGMLDYLSAAWVGKYEGTVPLAGDANGDGKVDVGDLGILAANYGGSGKIWSQGDFNGDGNVDVGDLGILAAHYGQGSNTMVDFNADYAKAFGTNVSNDPETDSASGGSSSCDTLGLPLIAGLVLMGLMLVKLEE
jgi:hypothetical protein